MELEIEAMRISASTGAPWPCSLKQAGTLAGYLTLAFAQALNQTLGEGCVRHTRKHDQEWIRENVRLPFLSYVFERDIWSCKDLKVGEANATFDFLETDGWIEALGKWMEVHFEAL